MKNTFIKVLLFTVLNPITGLGAFCQQSEIIKWYGGATDRIYASPVISGDKIYIGSIDGKLYCKDLESGRSYYSYQTGNRIASTPLLYNDNVILVSGNDLICFDPESISENWRFIPEARPELAKLDECDYHHSSPILHEGIVYFGCGNGVLYGVNPEDGQQAFSWSSMDNSPIRSTPAISDNTLYFGDWEGVIYAVDLNEDTLKWSTRTWAGQHYDNFAGILSQIEVTDNLIFYGARNHIIHSLNKSNGTIAWTYESPDGGWISGNPVLHNDRLLIAGSDNHKILCFNSTTGQLIWDFQYPGNCFSKPVIAEGKIVFTTGNAYANTGMNIGRGFVHSLNLGDGQLYREVELPGNAFSSPVLHNGIFYTGCDDKNIYALDGNLLAGINASSIGYFNQEGKPVINKFHFLYDYNASRLSFTLNQPGNIQLKIIDIYGKEITHHEFPGMSAGPIELELDNYEKGKSGLAGGIIFACLIFNGHPCACLKIYKF